MFSKLLEIFEQVLGFSDKHPVDSNSYKDQGSQTQNPTNKNKEEFFFSWNRNIFPQYLSWLRSFFQGNLLTLNAKDHFFFRFFHLIEFCNNLLFFFISVKS